VSDERFEELDERQRALALRLRKTLRDSEDAPDPTASARLAQARARAVAATTRTRPLWVFGGGLTAAVLLVALLVLSPPLQQITPETSETAALEAMDVLTDDLDNDFYEDLEMYRWLAQDNRV
jgi:hypothetical protein